MAQDTENFHCCRSHFVLNVKLYLCYSNYIPEVLISLF